MDQFSREFASHWDELVGWDNRYEAEMPFLLGLINKFNCKSVLDVALGTGFHSVQLLKEGLRVKSVDISPAMIAVANQNAKKHSVDLDAVRADWTELSRVVTEKFDCVLCLGNSFACEMDSEKRRNAVNNWNSCLSENGIVIVDRRNYEALLSDEYNFASKGQYTGETVKIAPSKVAADGTVFSYTFADGKTFDLNMYPVLNEDLSDLFVSAGLKLTELYGDQQPERTNKSVSFYTYIFERGQNAAL